MKNKQLEPVPAELLRMRHGPVRMVENISSDSKDAEIIFKDTPIVHWYDTAVFCGDILPVKFIETSLN